MLRHVSLIATVTIGLAAGSVAASAGTLIPVPPVPGSGYTAIEGINDSHEIVGIYLAPSNEFHAFFGTLDGNYNTFNYGGKKSKTVAQAIDNDGDVAGYSEVLHTGQDHPFILHADGTRSTVTRDGKRFSARLMGLTTDLRFVGQYSHPEVEHFRSFVGQGDAFQAEITLPFRHIGTIYANGINVNGDIVGYFASCGNCSYQGHAFLIRNGVASQIDFPNRYAIMTQFQAINDNGLAVGQWTKQYGSGDQSTYAFVYDTVQQRFRQIGSNLDYASSINNAGLVAVEDERQNDYIYCPGKKSSSCPNGAENPISVTDNWIPATPGSVRSVVCDHNCRTDLEAAH